MLLRSNNATSAHSRLGQSIAGFSCGQRFQRTGFFSPPVARDGLTKSSRHFFNGLWAIFHHQEFISSWSRYTAARTSREQRSHHPTVGRGGQTSLNPSYSFTSWQCSFPIHHHPQNLSLSRPPHLPQPNLMPLRMRLASVSSQPSSHYRIA